jgi:hypothetical protein
MFLSDKLLKIGSYVNMRDKRSIEGCITKMVDEITDHIKSQPDNEDANVVFNRVDKIWRLVAKQLTGKGKGFMDLDGFKNYIKSRPEYDAIVFTGKQ